MKRPTLALLLVGLTALGLFLWLDPQAGEAGAAGPGRRSNAEVQGEEALHPADRRSAYALEVGTPAVADQAEAPSDPVDPRGSVLVRLVCEDRPAAGGVVALIGSPLLLEGEVGPEGTILFYGLELGSYYPLVDPDSLPPGLAPPGLMEVRSPAQAPGFFQRTVELTADHPDQELEIPLVRGASILGRVLGPDGPLQGVQVRCQSTTPGLEGLAEDALTDADGRYLIDRILPGKHWMEVFTGEAHRELSRPGPVEFELRPAEVRQEDFTLGSGGCRVAGLVLDQDDEPFPDLNVLAFYSRPFHLPGPRLTYTNCAGWARTDAHGRFAFEGLFPTTAPLRTTIVVEPYFMEPKYRDPENPIGKTASTHVQLRPGSQVTLPALVVHRSRPFRVEGQVQAPEGAPLRDLRVTVLSPRTIPQGLPAPESARTRIETVRVDSEGRFSWTCETPREAVTLRVTRGSGVYEEQLTPIPNTTIEVSVPYP